MSKICNTCGAENSEDYKFCIACGNPLSEQGIPAVISSEEKTAEEPLSGDTLYGLPAEEVASFTGGKDSRMYSKLVKAESEGKLGGWNWPVFFFGVLAGMPFIWFFYRKLYKVGAILLAVSLAVYMTAAISVFAFYDSAFLKPFSALIKSHPELMEDTDIRISDDDVSFNFNYDYADGTPSGGADSADEYTAELVNAWTDEAGSIILSLVLVLLSSIAQFTVGMIMSAKANSIYISHMHKNDRRLRELGGGMLPEYEFAKCCGTNKGLAIGLGIAVAVIVLLTVEVSAIYICFKFVAEIGFGTSAWR